MILQAGPLSIGFLVEHLNPAKASLNHEKPKALAAGALTSRALLAKGRVSGFHNRVDVVWFFGSCWFLLLVVFLVSDLL